MERDIVVIVRESYGLKRCYPENGQAKLLAELTSMKTLTHRTLCLAERMGFSIVTSASTNWKDCE